MLGHQKIKYDGFGGPNGPPPKKVNVEPCIQTLKGESNPNKKLFLEEKEKSDKFIGESLNNIGQTIRKL